VKLYLPFCHILAHGMSTGTPSYVSLIKPGAFPLVLRNLHISAILLNSTLMILVLALVPLDVTLGGANVLSVLADIVSSTKSTVSTDPKVSM